MFLCDKNLSFFEEKTTAVIIRVLTVLTVFHWSFFDRVNFFFVVRHQWMCKTGRYWQIYSKEISPTVLGKKNCHLQIFL
jgi:hypothetical protein